MQRCTQIKLDPLSVLDEYMIVIIYLFFFFNTLCHYPVLNSAYVQNMLCLSF